MRHLILLAFASIALAVPSVAWSNASESSFKTSASSVSKSMSLKELNDLQAQLGKVDRKIKVTVAEIKKVRDVDFLPDLYFSLADLYLQKSRFMYLIKVGKSKGTPISELDFTAEKRPKQEAIEIYQKIYAFFPKSKLRDRALFYKGLEQRDVGQVEAMLKTFSTLNQEFPSSVFLREANIIVGDYFLEEKKDVEGALEAFRRVIAGDTTAYTPLAHYRIGWCYINQTKYPEAVAAFEEAIKTQATVAPELSKELPELYRKTDIKREAVVAMAIPYVENFAESKANTALPTVVHPVEYFQKVSDSHITYRKVLSRVVRRLGLKEMWQEVSEVATEVLIANSDPDAKFEAIQRWNEAVQKVGVKTNRLLLMEHAAITAQDLQTKSEMKGLTARVKKVVAGQLKFLEVVLRDIATRMQQSARDSAKPEDFANASRAYEFYQIAFPKSPGLAKMQINKAESLYRAEAWTRAGMEFEALSRAAKVKKKKDEFKESAIQSYVSALKEPEKLTALDLVRARRGMRDVGGEWLKTHMRHSAAATTAYNIGQSWYEDRLLPQAIQSFTFFVKNFARDERARDAIFMIINSYSQLDDFKGLVAAAKSLEKTPGLSAEDRDTIRNASRSAQLKEVQVAAGNFGSKEYAASLLSLASKNKNSAMGASALYEAFVSLRSKRDPELYQAGESLLEKHSDSTYTKEVVSSMAQIAIMTADFERAARYLSRFSDKYPTEKESKDWKKNAAQIYEWLGNFKEARRLYSILGDTESVVRCDFLGGDWPQLEKSAPEQGGEISQYYTAIAIWRQGRQVDALPKLQALTSSKDLDRSAQARFLIAQRALEAFHSIRMKNATDQEALASKVKSFQALSKELNDIIKLGAGRWTIASLYLLGQANFELGRFIGESPLPAGLKPNEVKIYKGELDKNAKQYKDAANQVFSQCLSTAERFEVFTRYVQGCTARGKTVVREEADIVKTGSQAKTAPPAAARALRAKLYDTPRNTKILHDLAQAYVMDGQYWTAIAIYNRILEIEPTNARAMSGIGVARLYLNDLDAGAEWMRKAIKQESKEPVAVWNLSGLYKEFGFESRFKQLAPKRVKGTKPSLLHTTAKKI